MKKEWYRYIGFIVTIIVLIVAVIIVKLSCASNSDSPMEPPTPVVTATEIPTNKPTAVPTNAPTATPTPTPELTPEITEEPIITGCEVSEEQSDPNDYEEEIITPEITEEPTETPAPTNDEEEPAKTKTIKSSSLSEVLQRGYHLYEVREYYGTYMLEPEYQAYLYDMCVKYGVEKYYKLMMAVMWHESNFNVKEISKTNDYGLMQINICNHGWLKKTLDIDPDFLNPYTSMECGVYMMSSYLIKYDDVHKALVAYNRGDNAVDKQGITETAYSRTVVDILVNKLFLIDGSEDDEEEVVVTAEPTHTEEITPTEEPVPTEEVTEETSEEEDIETATTDEIPTLEEMGEEY